MGLLKKLCFWRKTRNVALRTLDIGIQTDEFTDERTALQKSLKSKEKQIAAMQKSLDSKEEQVAALQHLLDFKAGFHRRRMELVKEIKKRQGH